ncbi:MAG: hypothetical protein MZW92_43555 [Comamonadaceae bacterium]|nr:hypothetical protein [Comamonadaceae bacterium]
MAEALIKGLLAQGHPAGQHPGSRIRARSARRCCATCYGVGVAAGNREVAARLPACWCWRSSRRWCRRSFRSWPETVTAEHLVVSILAGTATATLERLLGGAARVVRAMPNTPALVGCGATAICAGRFATAADLETACGAVPGGRFGQYRQRGADGRGDGPVRLRPGLCLHGDRGAGRGRGQGGAAARRCALELATRTVLGAARLVAESGEEPAVLRAKVCSPAVPPSPG